VARILIVDDSPEFRRLIEMTLQRASHETVSAEDGESGIRTAIIEQPDLILLDFMMPDMNGQDVFRLLRDNENTASIPVVMITAYSNEMDRIAMLRLGMDDFLTKPISPKELVARVDTVLYQRRSEGPSQVGSY
jgi:DNA-binding response OmpR family regulator